MQTVLPRKSRNSLCSNSEENQENQWLTDNEELELAQKYNINLSDATRDLIGKEVTCQSLNKYLKTNIKTARLNPGFFYLAVLEQFRKCFLSQGNPSFIASRV
jgi:hypothetical protein